MKNLIFALALSFSFTISAKECFTINTDDMAVNWTAYKTPAKDGVGGALKKFTIDYDKKAKSIKDIMKSAMISIDGSSVFTNNKARDKKIVKHFFQNAANNGNLKALVKKYTSKRFVMDLTFNGITKSVPMKYEIKNNTMTARGHIDVLDFSASKSLKAINKACYALHEGKTWSDVALELVASFKPCS